MFQITIPLLYIIAGTGLALSRLPRFASRAQLMAVSAFLLAFLALISHARLLYSMTVVDGGLQLTLANSASIVGVQLAMISLLGSFELRLRGLCGGLLLLAGLLAALTGASGASTEIASGWQLQAHILISLFAYGLLAVGAIVAVFGLIQERRLHSGRLAGINQLFAPLETTERLLFGICAAGFASLLLGVLSGFLFVDNLFAQHLVHKTVLSIVALILFGVLLAGRSLAGWRGRRAVSLYLWGFS
ncbi:MAG: cytochrome c biogenesis protein CcsA, partial [Woeseia sp.]